jgi:hypothetical protein
LDILWRLDVDAICEPFMKRISAEKPFGYLFDVGKGSGQVC